MERIAKKEKMSHGAIRNLICAVLMLALVVSALPLFALGRKDSLIEKKSRVLEVEVLTISGSLLEGKLIGGFLSSPSGTLTNKFKVGVRFGIGERMYLEDLELGYAELAHYGKMSKLPLLIKGKVGVFQYSGRISALLYLEANERHLTSVDVDDYSVLSRFLSEGNDGEN